ADARRLAGREVPREQGRGLAPHRVPRRRLRRGARVGEGARPPRDRRGAPSRQPGHDGRVRAPQDRVRHPDRTRTGVTPCVDSGQFLYPYRRTAGWATEQRVRWPTLSGRMPVPFPSEAEVLLRPPDAEEVRIIAGGVTGAVAQDGKLTSLQ